MDKLLLLHGAIGAKDQLDGLKQQLSNNYNVYSLNFSGHGGEAFKESFSIKQFASDVLLFMEKHCIEQTNVFGYSMGGYVALYLAKHYPTKIGKIVTLGTKFKWTPKIAAKEVKMLNADLIEAKVPAFAEALITRHTVEGWKDLMRNTAEMMIAMGEEPPLSLKDFENINHPGKIMLAENDEMVTKEETIAVVDALQNATFKTILNSKHPIEKVDIAKVVDENIIFM